jgi:hypothetical protein
LETHDHLGSVYYNTPRAKDVHRCTDIMYLYLTCSISYGVNLYLDLQNVNKFKFKHFE